MCLHLFLRNISGFPTTVPFNQKKQPIRTKNLAAGVFEIFRLATHEPETLEPHLVKIGDPQFDRHPFP